MATREIIAEASRPVFYTRVAFLALKAAQNVATESESTPNHANRLAYAGRVMSGEDKAILLALHVAAANPVIASALETTGAESVPDGDIEFVMGTIWNARADAFAAA